MGLHIDCESMAQASNKLYFCYEYVNKKEIDVRDDWVIGQKGGSITVMLWTRKPIGEWNIYLKIEKIWQDSVEVMSNERWEIEPDWNYIHLDDVYFPEDGTYKVTALKPDGTEIASNHVFFKYR